MYPTIALIGRPNTGKSTLFNRMVGRKAAITHGQAGTTRDRIFELIEFDGIPTLLVDTAGLLFDRKTQNDLELDIQKQSEIAINEADIILFVVDSRIPVTADDLVIAKMLRASNKDVIVVASKSDELEQDSAVYNLYELGLGDPVKVSAIHNKGLDILNTYIEKTLKKLKFSKFKIKKETDNKIRISFVGRPNVGKSSLVNSILGKEQVLVSDTPGTTRDSVDLPFNYEEQDFILTDTAGIRRSGKLRYEYVEKYSVLRSLRSIQRSDVCVLVIDSVEKLAKQDLRVSEFILEAKKGLIIVLNKADLLKPEQKNYFLSVVQHKMPYAHFAPVIFTSAVKGRNVLEILNQATSIYVERQKQIKTREINYFLEKTLADHPPKSGLKFKFVEQVDINPPTFLFFVNKADDVHFSYKRYLENALRQDFGFLGTALDLKFKGKDISLEAIKESRARSKKYKESLKKRNKTNKAKSINPKKKK